MKNVKISFSGLFYIKIRTLFLYTIPSKEYKVVRDFKWSGNFSEGALCENSQSLWHTHETQGPSTIIVRSHMPQLFTALSLGLYSADRQKADFRKSHFRWEYKVVHSFWNVILWQPGFDTAISKFFFFFSQIWLRLIDEENFLDCFFS